MKIAVNTRLLIKNKLDGIGWFTYETLKRITVQHPEHDFIFLFDRKYSEEFIFSPNITPIVIPPQARHPFLYFLWFEYSVANFLKKEKPDLFLSPDGFLPLSLGEGLGLSRTVGREVRFLPVIHDLNFEVYPKDLPFLTSKYYRHFFPKFARQASRITTVSEFSKQDIVKRYAISPEKVDVVFNGSNEHYKPVSESIKIETRQKISGGKPYFIFIGSLHPRKNIANLLKAFDEFKQCISPSHVGRHSTSGGMSETDRKEVGLVIVGSKMWWTSEMESAYESMKFKEEVLFTGRLEPEELGKTAAAALAMVYVSTYEGFGIPILEAMNCDVPVITSIVTSMPEVAGDAALLVDPFSIDSIKEAMLKIYSDENLRTDLIEKGRRQRDKFSWQKTADKLWTCIEKTMT